MNITDETMTGVKRRQTMQNTAIYTHKNFTIKL